jgi:hypothetical protein
MRSLFASHEDSQDRAGQFIDELPQCLRSFHPLAVVGEGIAPQSREVDKTLEILFVAHLDLTHITHFTSPIYQQN